jgi:hypothetical protein
MKVAETNISRAIWALQEALGERPEGMVVRIGCSFGAYLQWIRGERVPGGEFMLKLLALCPDEETFHAFFLDIGEVGSKIPLISRPEVPTEKEEASRPGAMRPNGTIVRRHKLPRKSR